MKDFLRNLKNGFDSIQAVFKYINLGLRYLNKAKLILVYAKNVGEYASSEYKVLLTSLANDSEEKTEDIKHEVVK